MALNHSFSRNYRLLFSLDGVRQPSRVGLAAKSLEAKTSIPECGASAWASAKPAPKQPERSARAKRFTAEPLEQRGSLKIHCLAGFMKSASHPVWPWKPRSLPKVSVDLRSSAAKGFAVVF